MLDPSLRSLIHPICLPWVIEKLREFIRNKKMKFGRTRGTVDAPLRKRRTSSFYPAVFSLFTVLILSASAAAAEYPKLRESIDPAMQNLVIKCSAGCLR